jgi:hypothetical protein
MKPWLKLPELRLTDNQKELLLTYFLDNEHLCYEHLSTKTGIPTGLKILRDTVPNSPEMEELNQKINPAFFKAGYYLGNRGVGKHTDGMRTCAILFELQNPDHIGTTFHWGDDTEILQYDDTYMINVKHEHSVQDTDTFRIFYQIELRDENSFEFYVDQYTKGNLLTC